MTEPLQPAAATAHERHDPELIAALAARTPDLPARDLAAARDLVERCSSCRDLLADLVAVQTALPTTSTPMRPRDFTLTAPDAARLRPRGWRRVIGFFGSARDGFSRPLAIGFTTIGLVALLFTALPSFQLGASRGGAVLSTVGAPVQGNAGAAAQVPAAAPSAAPNPSAAAASAAPMVMSAAPQPAASNGGDRTSVSAGPEDTAGDEGGVFRGSNDTDTQSEYGPPEEPTGGSGLLSLRTADSPSLGIVIGGISLIIGFGLFALRWSARRLGDN